MLRRANCCLGVVLLSSSLSSSVSAEYSCPLLVEQAEAPFRVRAVRTKESHWTADLFLRKWVPGAQLSLTWHSAVHVLQANQ